MTGDAALKRALLAEATARGEALTPAQLSARVSDIEANREITQTLSDLRAAGAEARYAAVDVTDGAAVRAAIDGARAAWGPVTGVIHGAGVVHDRLIAEKTDGQFEHVFATKVQGLAALLDATSGDPLRFLCAYSSVAARTGNAGQSDYAMANEVLNKVMCAERARRPEIAVVKSLGWGPWAGGMVTPALQAHFAERGVALIPIAEGARMLARELATAGDVEVVLGAAMQPRASRTSESGELALELVISRRTHPYLADHKVHGVPVLPVASVLDAFARLTHACRPDQVFVECRSLTVLRGVRLAHFEGHGDRFVLRARQMSNGDGATFAVELCGVDGVKHYTAITECRPRRSPPSPAPARPAGLSERPGEVYGRTLFHGPAFHVIRKLDGVARAGASAKLVSAEDLGWGRGWHADPALLDGALQLALLWTEHVLDGASLPTAIGALSLYGEGLSRGNVQCVLYESAVDEERAVSDVLFVAEDGAVVARLRGVETHLLPAKAPPAAHPDA